MKLYHYILAIISIIICLLFISAYGGLFYSSIAGHEGINAHFYVLYKNVSRNEFDLYNFFVSSISALVITILLLSLKNRNPKNTNRTLIFFLFFVGVVALCEVYLYSIFIGKG